ncbi:MAG TPA: aldo/keto reductase [Ramlibacter sp.]|uniref:aldo/keto reductase n=1 Tax=Ramlibacter sp. TaxID=1917967 RepID=UPI002D80FFD8|nr:aldo/keto reductase [Ramlibacter sp.]HET8747197.1 aldo/keto reductase [Ramlibacter sp.]
MNQQLALGTAQFGLDYGITNARGRVAADEARRMLQRAWDSGLRLLDTAPAYGHSEQVLGQVVSQPWRIATKTLPLRSAQLDAAAVARVDTAFRGSLARLGASAVDTLLVHHADDLLVPGGEALYRWLRDEQEAGRTARIGASVYDGEQVRALLARYRLDAVQLPASIADQRLLADGTVQRLQDAGVEIHVRSLYLQGLLLAAPAFVTARFPRQAAWAQGLHDEFRARGVSPVQACLSFFRAQPAFRVAVVGAASEEEVRALAAAWQASTPMDWSGWSVDNPDFTDPRQWTQS